MTTASEALIAIGRSRAPGVRFPSWAVATRSGHLVGLISEVPLTREPWRLEQVVRRQTITALLAEGLITLGGEEPVPEFTGSRHGLRWEPGRMGRRITVTSAGLAIGGPDLPRHLHDDAPPPAPNGPDEGDPLPPLPPLLPWSAATTEGSREVETPL
ncbi:hypothetical protein ACFWN1_17935 [Streptomyces sp. NPDC058459]|uniref:hypothetical protein n=1 Tax=Streptomyces sp. NPDC058459 TaxID=3346508 RepID=UPI003652C5C0